MYLALCILTLSVAALADPEVGTSLGNIVGNVESSVDNLKLETFLGIPYAKPPLGPLRFDYPQAHGKFSGVFEAKKFSDGCSQSNANDPNRTATYSEDCLSLNVFRPLGTKKDAKVPVLAVIHGGGFAIGHTGEFFNHGGPMVVLGDVIVVTFNYRLGIFGYGDMGDAAPGNLAFYDQILALEWIKEHIASFGGNPDKVTLMGVSAGSMHANMLIMSPVSRARNLFHAAVMDAGSIARGMAIPSEVTINRIKKIAQTVSCPTEGSDMVDCLRKVDAEKLLELSIDQSYSPILTFHPTLDGKVLMKDHENDIQQNSDKYKKVKMILGCAGEEGSLFVRWDPVTHSFISDNITKTEDEFVAWCEQVSNGYHYALDFKNESTRQAVVDTYMKQYSSPLKAVGEFMGDGTFICPVNAFVKSYSRHNTGVYVYRFERVLKGNLMFEPGMFGAYHFSPFQHFMGSVFTVGKEIEPTDRQFSIDSIKMIAEFVKTHEAPEFRGQVWPDFSEQGQIMVLDEKPSIRASLPHEQNCGKVFPYYERGLDSQSPRQDEL